MELLGQAYKFDNIDQFLGKLFGNVYFRCSSFLPRYLEKNPEAANFVKLLLDKMGCPKDDASKNCMPQLQKIKQAVSHYYIYLRDSVNHAILAQIHLGPIVVFQGPNHGCSHGNAPSHAKYVEFRTFHIMYSYVFPNFNGIPAVRTNFDVKYF